MSLDLHHSQMQVNQRRMEMEREAWKADCYHKQGLHDDAARHERFHNTAAARYAEALGTYNAKLTAYELSKR